MTRRFPARRALAVAALAVAGALVAGACSSADLKEGGIPTSTVGSIPRTTAPSGELPAATQSQLQAEVDSTMAAYDVPGVVVGVYVPGKGSWVHASGVADTTTKAAPTAEMAWPLRSVTKSFSVTLALQLVDEGKLGLDDTVDRYVDGVPNGDRITIRQLADMSSGLPEYTTKAFIADFVADPERVVTLGELNAYAFADPPQFQPGAQHVYTNTNTNVLGSVIERVTGQSFSEVVSERILVPLGLTHTQYLDDGAPWPEPHATGYQPDGGVLTDQPANFSIFGPAGALVSNLDDLRVWAEVLGSGSLLTASTQAERLDGHPLEKGPEYDAYGLGIGELDGWWGHTGEGFGFTALAMRDPATGATVVILMNLAKPADGAHVPTKLFRQLAPIVEGLS